MTLAKGGIIVFSTLALVLSAPIILGTLSVNAGALACTRDLVKTGLDSFGLFESQTTRDPNICLSSIHFFRQSAAWDPYNVQAEEWLGLINQLQGNYQESHDRWQIVLPRLSKDQVAEFRMGVTLYQLGRTDEAIEKWRQLKAAQLFAGTAVIVTRQKQFAAAEQYYRLALQIAPDLAIAHAGLGELLFSQNRFAEAREHDQRALELGLKTAMENSIVANRLGRSLLALNRSQEALPYLEQANELQPYAWYMIDVAKAYMVLGNEGKAEYWLRRAEHEFPQLAVGPYELGNYYLERGQLREAIASYERALSIDPECPYYCYANLGRAYFAAGCPSRAETALTEALRREPNNSVIQQWLQEVRSASAARPGNCP
jgi:tetratricopeptide (TPR) repeat protein